MFARHAGSSSELFIYALASGAVTRPTSGALDEPGGWSPDGKTIVFSRQGRLDNAGVYIIAANGPGLRRLTYGGAN